MKKFMVLSLAALVAGASALPAQADDPRLRGVAAGIAASNDDNREWRQERREHRGERREDRRENRGDRRDDRRDWRAERRDDRRDWRDDRRDDRRDWRAERRDDRREWRDDRRDWRHDRRQDHRYARHDDRRWRGNHWRPEYRYRPTVRYVYPPGYRAYRWQAGHRLPRAYYGQPYYVDYLHYRLPPPPYGHRWVRVDRDVVLVAITTGLILDVLYDLYY